MNELRDLIRSLTPEEKRRLREGLRSVEAQLRPLVDHESKPVGGAVPNAPATSLSSKSR